jgi:hypothetical protein
MPPASVQLLLEANKHAWPHLLLVLVLLTCQLLAAASDPCRTLVAAPEGLHE